MREPEFLLIAGEKLRRVVWGNEAGSVGFTTCPDCAVGKGEPHRQHCDREICPRCGGQLIACRCEPVEDCHA
jgi:hypothetical protein